MHFTDLASAIAAAAPGDTIRLLLLGQCYPLPTHYLSAVVDKPLTIVGVGGLVAPWQEHITVGGLLQVTGIQAGERVVLRGLRFMNPNLVFASGPSFGIDASNCAGDIVLDNCQVWAGSNGGATSRFVNCANVVMHDCEMVMGENPVLVTNSKALITNSLIRHNLPWTLGGGQPVFNNNSYGLQLNNSEVTLTASIVEGGDRYTAGNFPWGPKAAAHLLNSTLNVGPEALLIGGGSPPTVGYLMAGSGNEVVYLDPRGTIHNVPGGLANSPPVARDQDATMYDQARPGETFEYLIAGPPNGYAVLAFGNYQSPSLPTVLGDLCLDPFTMIGVGCHSLDGDGKYLGTLPVASGVGSPFVYGLQSLTLAPSGEFGVTTGTTFVLGWETTVSPY